MKGGPSVYMCMEFGKWIMLDQPGWLNQLRNESHWVRHLQIYFSKLLGGGA